MEKLTMEKLVNISKQYGFIFQGSEIYGGLANTWDYGPLGVELKNNIKNAWWQKFVKENKNNYGLDSAIFMNQNVWVASGHVGGFADPLTDCRKCKTRHRADKLIENFTDGKETGDGWEKEKLEKYIEDMIEYAEACVILSELAAEEAKLARLEVIEAQAEYEEKYGKE